MNNYYRNVVYMNLGVAFFMSGFTLIKSNSVSLQWLMLFIISGVLAILPVWRKNKQ